MKNFSLIMLVSLLFGMLCVCCGGDDDVRRLEQTELTLYVDDTEQLSYDGTATWMSDNDLIATVSGGLVTAKHVGVTTIHANDEACVVTVLSRNNQFEEPYMVWGSSRSAVESAMQGYSLQKVDSDYKSVTMGYVGRGNVKMYIYMLEYDALFSSSMVVPLSKGTIVTDFLTDRYVAAYVDVDEYLVGFMSVDQTIFIALKITDNGVLVLYAKNDMETKADVSASAFIDMINNYFPQGDISPESAALFNEIVSKL